MTPDPYYYTGASPKLIVTTNLASVEPPICTISYSCMITPVDLCSVNDGTTQASFVESTGRYSFESIDMANYTPGTYSLTVTITSGLKVDSFSLDIVLSDPCPTVDLAL